MEWNEISRSIDESKLVSSVSASAFDPYYELLWAGNHRGRVYSSCSVSLDRYSSSMSAASPVVGLLVDDKGVIALSHDSIRMTTRQGLTRWGLEKNEDLRFLRTMCFTGPARTEVVTAGEQQEALFVSATSGSILRRVAVEESVAVLRSSEGPSRMTICGSSNGRLSLRDPKTFKLEHSITAHLGGVTDIAVSGNLITTAGYSLRHGQAMFDPMVKIYDQRYLKTFAPVPFPAGPSILRRHPTLSSTVVASANSGHWQIIDLLSPSNTKFFQAATAGLMTTLDVSLNGEVVAFGDNQGYISLWARSVEANFSEHKQKPPFAAVPEPAPELSWSSNTPLNSIGMPYYDDKLLSAWPPHIYDVTPKPTKIDPDVLARMKMVDFVGYASNTMKYRRNQIILSRSDTDGPKFRSQKEKEAHSRRKQPVVDDAAVSSALGNVETKLQGLPSGYKKVEIKYSKFGVEDFDFGFYNTTKFSGLETHIINSYTNALLQLLHYTIPVRQICISHTRLQCLLPDCLACELGFLFRMLEDGKGQNCQASNFLKTFSRIPQASALGLFDREDAATRESYAAIIQNFNRFILDHLNTECRQDNNPRLLTRDSASSVHSPITQVFGLVGDIYTRCPCGSESTRRAISFTTDLLYPRKAMSNEQSLPSDFLSIVSASITRASSSRAWCAVCKKYQLLQTQRLAEQFPSILSINTSINTPEQAALWRRKGYLSETFQLGCTDGIVTASAIEATEDETSFGAIYCLTGIVLQVENQERSDMHLIALIKMPQSCDEESNWYIFNDFLVQKVSTREVLDFTAKWKTPAILYYTRADCDRILDLSKLPLETDTTALYNATSRTQDGVKPLSADEELSRGDLIAIDSEFVALEQEEFEIHSDGTKSIIRPSVLSLARVSVLRGQGPLRGVPFLDDFVKVTENIVDYLTEFSGIHPGDLDPAISRKVVVPLKEVYKKLRLLIDLGCIFVGHGLKKDFRIINLLVPPEQILDTVDIYHLPSRHRKVSLRFLAWFLFRRDIQPESGHGHDSVVDARTALECLVKYYDLLDEGRREAEWYDAVTPVLEQLYDQGRALGWRPPVVDDVQD